MTKAAKENHEPAATVQRGDGEDIHTSEGDGDDGGKESDHGETGGEEIWKVAADDADDAGDGVGYVLELFFAFLADGFVGGDLTGGAGDEVNDELAEAFEGLGGGLDGEAGGDDGCGPGVASGGAARSHGDAEEIFGVGGVKCGSERSGLGAEDGVGDGLASVGVVEGDDIGGTIDGGVVDGDDVVFGLEAGGFRGGAFFDFGDSDVRVDGDGLVGLDGELMVEDFWEASPAEDSEDKESD